MSVLRESFQYEVFRDLHDHLYDRFERPSLIVVVSDNEELKPCFPRKRRPVPNELYHHLIAATARSTDRAVIEQYKVAQVQILLRQAHKRSRWGWHVTHPGLLDLYLPIHAPESSQATKEATLIGVLVIGRFRFPGDEQKLALHAWLDELDVSLTDPRLPADVGNQDDTESYIQFLHTLVDDIPELTKELRERIQYEARRAIALLERFIARMAGAETLFGEEGLIAQLGLPEPTPSITFEEMWRQTTSALDRIASFLPLQVAALYSSPDRDYSEMELRSSVPTTVNVVPTIALRNLEEFTWLQGENWVNLPRRDDEFSWLDPRIFFGTENAMLFGRSTVGGHLILLVAGFSDSQRLAPSQRTALYDAASSRIFPFLHSALSAIELDSLMAETGHLLGRAIAKVTTGTTSMRELTPRTVHVPSEYRGEYELAQWAVDDGLTRLDLIRSNFYSFAASRRTVAGGEDAGAPDSEHREVVDIVEVLDSMRDFFSRAVKESPLKPIRYNILAKSLPTLGNRGALRMTLLNLFDNALKFSFANTFFTITARSTDGRAILEMENLGIGVAHDETRYVFRRLARSRFRDPHRRIEGLGLGLSYSRRVIEEIFRGRITLRSREAPTPHRRRFEGDNWLTVVKIDVPLYKETQT